MILMYHNIGAAAGFNTVPLKVFTEQLRFVKDHYEVVNLDVYIQRLKAGEKNTGVVLSFDDAYTGFYTMALPEIHRQNLPCVLYVPQSNPWHAGLGLMDEYALRDTFSDPLVTAGAHGLSHRSMRTLTLPEIKTEITESKKWLGEILQREILHFAFPFGQKKDYTSYALKVLVEAGYVSGVSTNYNRQNSSKNIYALNRIEVEPKDTIESFGKKCTQQWHTKYFKQSIKNILYRTGLR